MHIELIYKMQLLRQYKNGCISIVCHLQTFYMSVAQYIARDNILVIRLHALS